MVATRRYLPDMMVAAMKIENDKWKSEVLGTLRRRNASLRENFQRWFPLRIRR